MAREEALGRALSFMLREEKKWGRSICTPADALRLEKVREKLARLLMVD